MSRQVTIAESITFNPTGNTGSSRMTVTNASRGYAGTSNTSQYASISVSSTTAGYTYFTFSISDIPSDANITSVECDTRLAVSRTNRLSNSTIQLYNVTTAQGTATSVSPTTTSSIYSIASPGTWTTSNISNVRLRINGQRSGSNSAYIFFYGTDLTVNYNRTGTEYEVSIENNSLTTTASSPVDYVFQGKNHSITFFNIDDINKVSVTDNNTDVTSSLVYNAPGTRNEQVIPSSLVDNNGTITNQNNGLSNTDSTTYAEINGQDDYYMIYGFDVSEIPQNATINSVSCSAKVEHTHTRTTYGSVQLYSGSTAKGSASTFRTTETVNLTTGTWTRSELSNIRIRIGSTYTGNTTTYYTRFYGADLTINYTVNEASYTYTISNISADHAIIVDDREKQYIKLNNEYKRIIKFYKKVNNVWVETAYEDLNTSGPYIHKS